MGARPTLLDMTLPYTLLLCPNTLHYGQSGVVAQCAGGNESRAVRHGLDCEFGTLVLTSGLRTKCANGDPYLILSQYRNPSR